MTDTIDLADIDDALAAASPTIDRIGRRVAMATYRTLALGEPASTQEIANVGGVEADTVAERLDAWGAVFRDDAGDVIGFWGLALPEMPHRLHVAGRDLYAWCAWDPLFLAQLLGPLSVATDDPHTGEQITYGLDQRGNITDLSHPESVLSFLRPDQPWDEHVMSTFCHYVLHFASPATAEAWTARHEGTFVLDLTDSVELARRHVQRTFGDAR